MKTVLAQERVAENRIYCFDNKNTSKWSYCAEIKSVPDFKCISPKQFEVMISTRNNGFGNPIFVNIPRIKQPIELFTLFRAMGVTTDRDICKYIVLNIDKNEDVLACLQASIVESNHIMNQEDAFNHIMSLVLYCF